MSRISKFVKRIYKKLAGEACSIEEEIAFYDCVVLLFYVAVLSAIGLVAVSIIYVSSLLIF